jgi:hypothetical protein
MGHGGVKVERGVKTHLFCVCFHGGLKHAATPGGTGLPDERVFRKNGLHEGRSGRMGDCGQLRGWCGVYIDTDGLELGGRSGAEIQRFRLRPE